MVVDRKQERSYPRMGNYRPRYFEHIHHRTKQRAGGSAGEQPDRQR